MHLSYLHVIHSTPSYKSHSWCDKKSDSRFARLVDKNFKKMKLIGPKCSSCCTIVAVWGIVMFVLLGVFFQIRGTGFYILFKRSLVQISYALNRLLINFIESKLTWLVESLQNSNRLSYLAFRVQIIDFVHLNFKSYRNT